MRVIGWIAVVVTALAAVSAGAAQPVHVGVYEPEYVDPVAAADSYDPKTKTYSFKHGKSRIRLAFVYDGGEWKALPTGPGQATLQAFPPALTFRDLETGRFRIAATRGKWFDGDQLESGYVGSYDLSAPMPKAVLHPAGSQGNWVGDFRYARVLLTTSAAGKAQPIVRAAVGPAQLALLLPAMRRQVPTYAVCDQPEHRTGDKAWSNGDVRVAQALRVKGGLLVALELNDKLDRCEFVDGGAPDAKGRVACDYCSHWFLLASDDKVRELGNAMTLIGGGDLAGDGRAEWLFSQSAENHDSYILYADDFATRVSFGWSYH